MADDQRKFEFHKDTGNYSLDLGKGKLLIAEHNPKRAPHYVVTVLERGSFIASLSRGVNGEIDYVGLPDLEEHCHLLETCEGIPAEIRPGFAILAESLEDHLDPLYDQEST